MILGFDPGKDKCGVAVMGWDRQLHYHQVIPSPQAIATLQTLRHDYPITQFVMGNQTTSKQWQQKLTQELTHCPHITLVDERYSTLQARDRYWEMYPPQGLMKLVPRGMREPHRPIDDIVAILLIERFLDLPNAPENAPKSGPEL